MKEMDDDTYGNAWLDHARWLRRQADTLRRPKDRPERLRLKEQAMAARDTGIIALGYKLRAQILPFRTAINLNGTTPYDYGPGTGAEYRHAWWVCRYCDRGEGSITGMHQPMTVHAERGRCVTHEVWCDRRTAADPVTDDEKRIMHGYLSGRVKSVVDLLDNEITMFMPKPGYRQSAEQNAWLARLQVQRAEMLAVLTQCGVDDAAMAALPAPKKQTQEEFVAEIREISGSDGS